MPIRGFGVDYGCKKTDPNKEKIHELETRGDYVGQYQLGPDGWIHWYPVQVIKEIDVMSPKDQYAYLYKMQ
jgi:hypothetical protein